MNETKTDGQQADSQNYENFVPLNGNISVYENVVTPRNNGQVTSYTLPRRKAPKTSFCEVIENKFLVSDDDLLDAIEQLKMLPKCNDTVHAVPERINSEKYKTKSNEAKADKEKNTFEEDDRRKYIEFLQNEKRHIMGNIEAFKRSVADIENQEEEISREVNFKNTIIC